jgi:hypothetical protein
MLSFGRELCNWRDMHFCVIYGSLADLRSFILEAQNGIIYQFLNGNFSSIQGYQWKALFLQLSGREIFHFLVCCGF